MSAAVCKTRSRNACSLGSHYDWIVVLHGVSPKDSDIKAYPKVLARVEDFYAANSLVEFYVDKRRAKGLYNPGEAICTYSYSEFQTMLERFDGKVFSLEDPFWNLEFDGENWIKLPI